MTSPASPPIVIPFTKVVQIRYRGEVHLIHAYALAEHLCMSDTVLRPTHQTMVTSTYITICVAARIMRARQA